jgi:chromosome segregation ATPase
LLNWLWNERQDLLSQLAQTKAVYNSRVTALEALNKDVEAEYERKIAAVQNRVDELSSASDSLRGQLRAAQQRIGALSAEQCQRASGKLIEHLGRGTELASRCAAQLERTDAALGACVRSYENVKNVYDPHR